MTEMDLLKGIGAIDDSFFEELYGYLDNRSKPRRPRIILLAAVIAALLFALTAGAAGVISWENSSWFESFFALPVQEVDPDAVTDHQLELLDKGLVEIGQKQTHNGYTITLVSALCDGHRLLAKIKIEAPEGTVLEKGRYDVILDYKACYPDGAEIPFGALRGGCSQLEDVDTTDGTLQFLLDVLMQPDPEADENMLMGAKWEIQISEILYAYSREDAHWIDPLATGDWSFVIPFDETSLLTREEEVLARPIFLNAERCWNERSFPIDVRVTSLKLRALSATLSFDKPLTGFWHGVDMVGDIYIVMKDGTKIMADWDMGFNKGKYWQDTFTFPVPVAWEDVAYILLPNGEKLEMK